MPQTKMMTREPAGPETFRGILPTMLNNWAAWLQQTPKGAWLQTKGDFRASITFFSVGPSLASYWTITTCTSDRNPRTAKDRTTDSSMSESYIAAPTPRQHDTVSGAYRVRGVGNSPSTPATDRAENTHFGNMCGRLVLGRGNAAVCCCRTRSCRSSGMGQAPCFISAAAMGPAAGIDLSPWPILLCAAIHAIHT